MSRGASRPAAPGRPKQGPTLSEGGRLYSGDRVWQIQRRELMEIHGDSVEVDI
ncbi:hypothetical protein LNV09_06735 [Paucibacter sp. B2R-40]|uniref:hypothetical protein n=1 Tax=Paucibacter sp. B2R-40 TaxID=2893554 RepID=UPI0021E3A0E5|nr:hypothetical protein [Paucibacter sp. B2R-40]MCV2353860.1 hypothetical protein [Paucibacter sp. B2R-40]